MFEEVKTSAYIRQVLLPIVTERGGCRIVIGGELVQREGERAREQLVIRMAAADIRGLTRQFTAQLFRTCDYETSHMRVWFCSMLAAGDLETCLHPSAQLESWKGAQKCVACRTASIINLVI